MKDDHGFNKKFNYLGKEFTQEILEASTIRTIAAGTELIREGQYIKSIPIVLTGLIKVVTHFEDKELLLYYIQPEQTCIMSFSSCIHQEQSKIFAITEEESIVLLMPSAKVSQWVIDKPAFNQLFFKQYDLRYSDLVDTIGHLLYYKLDRRVLDYLTEKVNLVNMNPIKISHKEIANDLGTAREVVSRIIKKLEKKNLLKQHHDGIELILSE